jgi:hypothetical protein
VTFYHNNSINNLLNEAYYEYSEDYVLS